MSRVLLLPIALAAALAAPSAHAAESKDTCTGFVASLPAVITTQGTWCMDHDLATTIASGKGIWIQTNNVTLDCNHFKLGNLGAGIATQAVGVYVSASLNVTIRNCNIRGWRDGVILGGGGHVVENSRFDANRGTAIGVSGAPGIIRGNLVTDTGGSPSRTDFIGIRALAGVDVIDNVVTGVYPESSVVGAEVFGIDADFNGGARIRGNAVRELMSVAGSARYGIRHNGGESEIHENYIVGPANAAIRCTDFTGFVFDNRMANVTVALDNCDDAGGNLIR